MAYLIPLHAPFSTVGWLNPKCLQSNDKASHAEALWAHVCYPGIVITVLKERPARFGNRIFGPYFGTYLKRMWTF